MLDVDCSRQSGTLCSMKRILKWIVSNRLDWKRERDWSVVRGEDVGMCECLRECVSARVRLEMQLRARVHG